MFINHESSVKPNSHVVLPQFENKKIVANYNNEYYILSNVCPHQGSLISAADGSGNRTCPYHNWTFDEKGNPVTSGRTGHYCQNKTSLKKENIYLWNSLLLSKPFNLDLDIDFSNMRLHESRVDVVNAPWQNILDLFLDVDHVQTVHAGVYDRIGLPIIRDVEWHYFDDSNVQVVRREDNSIGAVWITLYPGTMIEWQAGALFITVVTPSSNQTSKVSVFKFRDLTYDNNTWALNENIWETAWMQDKNQAELLVESPNISNLEESKIHFRNWLKNVK